MGGRAPSSFAAASGEMPLRPSGAPAPTLTDWKTTQDNQVAAARSAMAAGQPVSGGMRVPLPYVSAGAKPYAAPSQAGGMAAMLKGASPASPVPPRPQWALDRMQQPPKT